MIESRPAISGSRRIRRPRRLRVVAIVLFSLVSMGVLLNWVNAVDSEEPRVLETFLTDALDDADVADLQELEHTTRIPCWWWCEDYDLDVVLRAELVARPAVSPTELCEAMNASISEIAGTSSASLMESDRSGRRQCWFAFDAVRFDGRDLTVVVDVSTDSTNPVDVSVVNDSAQRAFLPWEWNL